MTPIGARSKELRAIFGVGFAKVRVRGWRRQLETERALAPSELESEALVEQVTPPTLTRPDKVGQLPVIVRGPRLIREEPLEQRLQGCQHREVDAAERIAGEVRHRAGCEPAVGDLSPALIADYVFSHAARRYARLRIEGFGASVATGTRR